MALAFADLAEFDSESYVRLRMPDLTLQGQGLLIDMERQFHVGAHGRYLFGQDQASNL